MTLSMNQMGNDPAFERFLGATVGEDVDGTDVSVLSMLARLGLDPWTEAADLAAMPDGSARKRLDALMSRFNDVPALALDRGKIVSALLAFLPNKRVSSMPSVQSVATKLPRFSFSSPVFWIVATVLVLGWIVNLAQGQ